MTATWQDILAASVASGIKPMTIYARLTRYGYSLDEACSLSPHGKKKLRGRKAYIPRRHPCDDCGALMKCSGGNRHICQLCRTVKCEQCGVNFVRRGANRPNRFCNVACQAEHQKTLTGESSANWKGGVDKRNRTARQKIRNTPEHKEWRRLVLERDRNTCVRCGFVGTGNRGKATLHAHHKKSFSGHPKLRFDVDNGITLCIPCHSAAHRKPKQGKLFKRLPYRTKTMTTNIKGKYRCHKVAEAECQHCDGSGCTYCGKGIS